MQVRIVLEGADKFNNLIGSVHYPEGDSAVDLSYELVKQVTRTSVNMNRLPLFLISFDFLLAFCDQLFL
jgi:hypothetical protein